MGMSIASTSASMAVMSQPVRAQPAAAPAPHLNDTNIPSPAALSPPAPNANPNIGKLLDTSA